jgi:hypothetical protein
MVAPALAKAQPQSWAVVRAQVEQTLARLRAFDPDEPRDESGKWTEGGGDGGSATEASSDGDKKTTKVADFAKDDVLIDEKTRTDPDKQKKFIDNWNAHVAEPPGDFKKDFLGGLKGSMRIHYRDNENSMTITGKLQDDNGNKLGEYTREIDLRGNDAASSYFKIDSGKQGKDIGKRLLAANVATYQKMGLDAVSVHANINVGGYAWAKYGYVPTDRSWESLSREIEGKIERMSSGGSGGGATSWEELGGGDQDRIEHAFYDSTFEEFLSSEQENWQESGEPLHQAKTNLAENFDHEFSGWAKHAIEGYRKALADNSKPDIPFTNNQLLAAISVAYDDSHGDGRGDAEVNFDDDKLQEPKGYDPAQQTLPGIEPVEPHEHLTEDMRDGLTSAIQKAFDRESEKDAGNIDAPDYLSDSAREYQQNYWDGMDDEARFNWAERHASDIVEGAGPSEGTGEMDEADADRLRTLTNSSDPKALWTIADSKYGKDLLLGTDWNGVLDLHDKETMDRFNAYVGKASKKA